MGFLDRAIRQGVSRGVGNAIGKAVEQAVAPKAAELANKTAQQLNNTAGGAARQTAQTQQAAYGGAFSELRRAAEGLANEAAKNMKMCPSCGEPAGADLKFCPSCGTKLPEETLAQGAVCAGCGKQNSVGAVFCTDCGAKLPAAAAMEQAAAERDAAVMAHWDERLSAYPRWTMGGSQMCIEDYGGRVMFSAKLPSAFAAENAVRQYRDTLVQNGFRQAGQYPDPCHLYKMVGGVCFHVDTEHCFEGDSDTPALYFNMEQPSGGFDYVKPAASRPVGLKDLFNL